MTAPIPPKALPKPYQVKSPFGVREDEFYWLRDDKRENPEMLAYLNAENAYADSVLEPLKPLQKALYDEMLARIKEDDASLPYLSRGYWYYTRTEKGKNYGIQARRKHRDGLDTLKIDALNQAFDFKDEEILLNVNELAEGHDFYSAFVAGISHQSQIMVWGEDTNGRRQYVLRFKNLITGEDYPETIENTNGSVVWAEDGKTFFYIENHPETLLSKKVYRYDFSTKKSALVYEEPDDSFYLGLDKTRDRQFIMIQASSTVSDEVLVTSAENPTEFQSFRKRQRDLEYSLEHFNDTWYIRTNIDGATNFKIMTAKSASEAWQEWIPHDEQVLNYGVELFNDFAVVAECSEAMERLKIIKNNGESFYLSADESVYSMGLSANLDPESPWLRYSYTSMITPSQTFEINVLTGEKRLLKAREVPTYQRENYRTERLWITARDGVKVPVSLVYHKDTPKDGTAPVLQYGYGSYGASMMPSFSSSILSLLDRGVIYALAHIRGGEELGRQWYDNGKMFHKKNTFNDFIDVTKALIEQKYAHPKKVGAMGGSAGGLLMGVIANEAPELYRVIISQVPFVDVVTTMLDPSIPLTTNEYDEWGNPEASEASYKYMLSYSPYDNLKAQAYPAMFVGTGLWDSQVQYWEPAKYVARLRNLNQSAYPIVFRINMEAGHGGKSGRYKRLEEQAEQHAFLLNQLGGWGAWDCAD